MNYGLLAPDEQEYLKGTAMTSGLLSALAGAAGSAGRPWGQVIGNALSGGLQGYQGTFDNAYQQKLMQQKLAQQEQEQSQKQQEFAWRKAEAERNAKAPIKVGNSLLDPVTMKPVYTDVSAGGVEFGLVPQVGLNPSTGKPEKFVQGKDGNTRWLGIMPTLDEIKTQELIDAGVISPDNPLYSRFQRQIGGGVQPTQNNQPQAALASPSAMPTNNFNTPYPVTWSGPTATDIAEGTSPNMQLRDPANPNLPPKMKRDVTQKQIEAQIDVNKQKAIDQNQADIAVDTEDKKEKAKKTRSMSGIGSVIDEARYVLTNLEPTASGVGTVVDKAFGFFGKSTQGSPGAAKLKTIGGNLIMKMPRMEGPQSDADRIQYQNMAGAVGDSTLPIADRLAALAEVERLYRQYDKESNIIPSVDAMDKKPARSKQDILKQYGVR